MPWLILVVFLVTLLVTFLVLSLLLLLCAKNPFGFPDSCLCWREKKDVEPPVEDHKFNEQSHHQGSGLNILVCAQFHAFCVMFRLRLRSRL